MFIKALSRCADVSLSTFLTALEDDDVAAEEGNVVRLDDGPLLLEDRSTSLDARGFVPPLGWIFSIP